MGHIDHSLAAGANIIRWERERERERETKAGPCDSLEYGRIPWGPISVAARSTCSFILQISSRLSTLKGIYTYTYLLTCRQATPCPSSSNEEIASIIRLIPAELCHPAERFFFCWALLLFLWSYQALSLMDCCSSLDAKTNWQTGGTKSV